MVVFEFVGTGLVLPFWVVYLHEVRGFSLSTAGLLIGLQPLAGLLAAGPGGSLIDRCGARVVLLGSLGSVLVGQLVMSVAATVPVAAVAMTLSGIAFGVSFPASQTLVATIVPSPVRQRYFGVNFTLLNLGIGIGGLLGGALVDVERLWTFQLLYLADAVTYLPALYLLLVPLRHVTGRAAPGPGLEERPSYAEVLRLPGVPMVLLLGFAASFVGYAQLNSGLPAFARAASEISTQALGVAFAANTAVIVLVQLVVLQRIEGHRRTRVLVLMAALWALSWLLLGASGLLPGSLGGTVLVVTAISVFALGETMLQPTLPAITNDLTPDRLRGRTNAIGSAAFQLPMVLGPVVSGFLIGHGLELEYVVLLVLGCLALALLAVLALEPQLTPQANGTGSRGATPEDAAEGTTS